MNLRVWEDVNPDNLACSKGVIKPRAVGHDSAARKMKVI